MNIIQKIAKARLSFTEIKKNVKGYDYKYADLDGIMDAINPALLAEGLHVYHTYEPSLILQDDPYLLVTCHISDGESELTSTIPLPLNSIKASRNSIQEMGKALTYGRRYSIAAALCLTAEEDTDAQSPEQLQKRNQQGSKPVEKPVEKKEPRRFTPSEAANKWLEQILDELKIAQDIRPTIRDQVTGKTMVEIKQLALGVVNAASGKF